MSACHKDCYTKGRGCVISGDGTCPYVFAMHGGPSKTTTKKEFKNNLSKIIQEKFEKSSQKGKPK